MTACANDATEQFVWIDLYTDLYRISPRFASSAARTLNLRRPPTCWTCHSPATHATDRSTRGATREAPSALGRPPHHRLARNRPHPQKRTGTVAEMTAARFLVGDVFDRMAELEDGSVDLVLTSPPFLALRSYLPDGHPDKAKEIGSEATPAAFLDTMLALTAEWGRLLAPHGSIAVEIGDTYSGSGGAGGDYNDGGLRDGQERFNGAAAKARAHAIKERTRNPGPGWPLAKSLALIPELYAASLAYGRNLLTGVESPAGRWRVRNIKPWIRSNPPVGALVDKERPATSYITVATRGTDRYFDLDAVRTGHQDHPRQRSGKIDNLATANRDATRGDAGKDFYSTGNPGGAPPLDWWHHADAVIDAEIDRRAGKGRGADTEGVKVAHGKPGQDGDWHTLGKYDGSTATVGARGVHIRRALENAGILTTHDALDVSPRGYAGSHYAVWPKELVRLLVDEMCPRRVCTTCGLPSRRIVGEAIYTGQNGKPVDRQEWGSGIAEGKAAHSHKPDGGVTAHRPTVDWSDCGHGTWRPGHVLDPFAGSGTTLAVCTGMARTATGVDIDERNAELALERVGMFLHIDHGTNVTERPA